MNRSILNVLSFVNESGAIATTFLMIGYFGSRSMLGWLPLFVAVLCILASFTLAYLLAKTGTGEDSAYDNRFAWLDKFIAFSLLFLFGMAMFGTIGTWI